MGIQPEKICAAPQARKKINQNYPSTDLRRRRKLLEQKLNLSFWESNKHTHTHTLFIALTVKCKLWKINLTFRSYGVFDFPLSNQSQDPFNGT